jgi:hypothetical protein
MVDQPLKIIGNHGKTLQQVAETKTALRSETALATPKYESSFSNVSVAIFPNPYAYSHHADNFQTLEIKYR